MQFKRKKAGHETAKSPALLIYNVALMEAMKKIMASLNWRQTIKSLQKFFEFFFEFATAQVG